MTSTNRLISTFATRSTTTTEIVSYDVPTPDGLLWKITVEYLNQIFVIGLPNIPSHPDPVAAGSIFLVGAHFGQATWTSMVRAQHSASMVTKWLSSTLVQCKMASGMAESRTVLVTAGTQRNVGSISFVMSYDGVAMYSFTYHSAMVNVLQPGARIHTVSGDNFGIVDTTPQGRLATAGEKGSWKSDTSISIKMASGHALRLSASPFYLTGGMIVGSLSNAVSYDRASASKLQPANVPTLSIMYVGILGINVGSAGTTTRASLGYSACAVTDWLSGSSLTVRSSNALGNWKEAAITIATTTATISYILTYDSPCQSSLVYANAPTTTAYIPRIFATNLGISDYTPRSSIGGTAAQATRWMSETAMSVTTASGIMQTLFEAVFVVTVGVSCPKYVDEYGLVLNYVIDCMVTDEQVGTTTRAFSYNIASIEAVQGPNFQLAIERAALDSRGDSLSIRGTNFGRREYSDKIRLGSTGAEASRWTSDSSLSIRFGDGLQGSRQVVVTVGSAGSRCRMYTYFAPAILMPFRNEVFDLPDTFISNGPGTGAVSLFVHGCLMGHSSYTPKVRVSESSCGSTLWTSDSSISCAVGQGGGGGPIVTVTAGQLTNSASNFWSYDGPHPFQIVDITVNGQQGFLMLLGSNYVSADVSQTVRFGNTNCELSKWTATTSITCRRPSGLFGGLPRDVLIVTVLRQFKTLTTLFSYDIHKVQGALKGNSPSTGINV
jgi:hypothetical protein